MRIGFILAGLLWSGAARAADASPGSGSDPVLAPAASTQALLRVLLRGCAGLREAEVERVLAAELAADSLSHQGAREPTWVVASCSGTAVVLEVHDPRSEKTIERRFEFGRSEPKARARLIAIAAAELVLASWAEHAAAPLTPVEAEKPAEPSGTSAVLPQSERGRRLAAERRSTLLLGTDPELAREGVGPRGERVIFGDYVWERFPARTVFRIVALSSVRRFADLRGVFAGGGVRFGADLFPLHAWAFDLLIETGTLHRQPDAPLHVESWTLGGTLGWVGELGGRVAVRGGAGLRAGLLRTRERGGRTQLGLPAFWGWPVAAAGGSLFLGRLTVELSGEAGYAALALGPGTGGPSARGVWSGAQVGIGMRL